jgi:hypothetical protein
MHVPLILLLKDPNTPGLEEEEENNRNRRRRVQK